MNERAILNDMLDGKLPDGVAQNFRDTIFWSTTEKYRKAPLVHIPKSIGGGALI